MARTSEQDPIKVFRYAVTISGFGGVTIGFTEITGIESETEKTEYREGGMNDTVQKSPGLTKFADVVFKKGQMYAAAGAGAQADLCWEWMQSVYNAAKGGAGIPGSSLNDIRREISVTQFMSTGTIARRWKIVEAWPCKWKPFTDLNGTSSDNSIEELTIAHEGFSRQ
jgi:phage tail-like protein